MDKDEEPAKIDLPTTTLNFFYDLDTFELDTRLHQTDAKNTHEDEDLRSWTLRKNRTLGTKLKGKLQRFLKTSARTFDFELN